MAATATATPRVAEEIAARLGLRQWVSIRSGFDRPNLTFDVVSFEGKGAVARKRAALTNAAAPTDKLPDPQADDVPTLEEALKIAASHRPEIEQADLNLRNGEYAIQGTRNALLPSEKSDVNSPGSVENRVLDGRSKSTFFGKLLNEML